MTANERKEYRIACMLYDSMCGESSAMVCKKHGVSRYYLKKREEEYSTSWVLRKYQEAIDMGFIEDYII